MSQDRFSSQSDVSRARKKSLKHTHFGARKTNTEKAGSNNPWNACRSWDMRLSTQPERALARIIAYRQRAPPADQASLYEERSRARPPVLSPLPLKANTETSDEMCSTVIATPTNRAGIVSRGVASRFSLKRPLPRERMPGHEQLISKYSGHQRFFRSKELPEIAGWTLDRAFTIAHTFDSNCVLKP